ncbi:MAG: aminoglycoside phosphotransferase family protein [Acidobacteria bacterium]|nr:aminoglycoside phosphotransferase family protein [Acidobacteriota bacterium]
MKFFSITSAENFDSHFQDPGWADAVKEICTRHRIRFGRINRAAGSEHVVFLIDDKLVVKIYRPARNCFDREKRALEIVGEKCKLETPAIVEAGEFGSLNYLVTTQLRGLPMTRAEWLQLSQIEEIEIVSQLAENLRSIHSLTLGRNECDWPEFTKDRAATFVKRQIALGVGRHIIDALPAYIDENLKLVPTTPMVFLHGDVHFGNLRLVKNKNRWRISGLFDFADSRWGFHEYDFLAVGVLMLQGQREIQQQFLRAYGYRDDQLDEKFRKRLMMLTMLYETSDLRRYAMRLRPEAVNYTLDELEKAIWSFAN